MRRRSASCIILIMIGVIALGLGGCKAQKESSINFFNYGENIDQETLAQFEEQTGIKVNVETFDDMETMYQKVSKSSAAYDVILVSDALMPRMIDEKLVQPINKDKIPSIHQMDENYLNLSIDPGNTYSVPYMFGTVGLVYNKEMVKEPVDSWAVLWNEAYKGRVFMFDTYRDTFGATLKYLGYSLNETNPVAIQAATKLLLEQREKTAPLYGVDNGTELIPAGETYINMIWSGEGLNLQEENPNLVYVVPKEGANFWVDSLCISSKSKNVEEAQSFINFVSDKDSALRIADEIGYTTPNKEARALQPESVRNNVNAYMTKDMMMRCEIYVDFPTEVKELYFKEWTKVKAER